ncbi:50S ribosomal protein L4 [Janthinobacterium agaricidamnosum]|uniref:50S ribosomal protein L4 n=1 Tax=Janthinobacterium agaricidamnosum TaxID=55508 RepID=UPI003D32B1A6
MAREERLIVIDDLTIDAPKTKLLSQKLNGLGFDSVLIITDVLNETWNWHRATCLTTRR